MLILTRKRDESIRIGEDVVVHVMRTAKGSVKIVGIEAPASVRDITWPNFTMLQPSTRSRWALPTNTAVPTPCCYNTDIS